VRAQWHLLLLFIASRRAGRGRALLAALGVALGVGLGLAVQLVNDAALAELERGVRALAGEADLRVEGGRQGFPEAIYPRIARLRGVAAASPVLEIDAALAAREGSIRLVGIDPLRAARLSPALLPESSGALRGGWGLLAPDTLLVSSAAAQRLGLQQGSYLELASGLERVRLEVLDVLPEGALQGMSALADVSTLQWRFGRLGELTRVDVQIAPGADREQVRGEIAALLPGGARVAPLEAVLAETAYPSRAYRVNLGALALIALFTGGFMIFSVLALETARRRREHALLRILGLEARGLLRLVLGEALVLGAAGAALGVALGYALALAALRFAGADLGAGAFRGLAPSLEPSAAALLAYFAAGTGLALAGAWLPAREAARLAPAAAIRPAGESTGGGRRLPWWPSLALFAAAALLAALPPIAGLPLAGYASIACLLLGGIALLPRAVDALLAAAPLPRRVAAALALAQLRGASRQASFSLAAIVASFSLTVAMAIMVGSFRDSLEGWLGRVLPADLYVRSAAGGETAFLDERVQEAIRALPGVASAEFLRVQRIGLGAARAPLSTGLPPVALIARDAAAPGLSAELPLVGGAYAPRAGDPPPAWISEALAERLSRRPGERIDLPFGGKLQSFVVAGIWRDYARQHGAVLIERPVYRRITGDARANDAALRLARGANPADLLAALRALPGGELLEIADSAEIRRASLGVFDRSFAVTYGMEAIAVLVGLFALSSSIGAIVLARRREFGVLRHLGVTRRAIGAMLALEGALLAGLGALAGLALGAVVSLVLIRVVNRQSFGWSIDLHAPYATLAALSALLVALAAATAWLAGREAMRIGAVRAVREDW
jgi:putative ABC transport system permease protein